MGQKISIDDPWIYADQPHTKRRTEMLSKYHGIKRLFKVDHHFKFVVLALVALQIITCYLIKDTSWAWILFWVYAFGGVVNQQLTMAIHETCHNIPFGNIKCSRNRYFSILINLPCGIPIALSMKKYHMDHHRYLGTEQLDIDVLTKFEGLFFHSPLGKFIWLMLHPIILGVRPLFVHPKPVNYYEILNVVVQIAFDIFILRLWGLKPVAYMILCLWLGATTHPVAGHFISEHMLFQDDLTYSYYGPLNKITFNVGYHNEHHDFPFVPGSKLPLVKKIAPEYYDDLPHHTSWSKVLYNYLFDPKIHPDRGNNKVKYREQQVYIHKLLQLDD